LKPKPNEKVKKMQVRFRTIGDATCTGATFRHADSLERLLQKLLHLELQKEEEERMIKDLKLLWKTEKKRDIFKDMSNQYLNMDLLALYYCW
jgi:hypothetical protein